MSTSKWSERIGAVMLALCLLITLALYCVQAMGAAPVRSEIGYERRLFDTAKVHTIDIVMDDWDGFLETCENEEYTMCAVVIDGESSRNVGIRAKGNTSLRNVAGMGSSRYSFKIEFDHYDSGRSYHGLDKLSLNNLIQDNTCMKDYLAYQMMNAFGADSPLCSYAHLTVNGEDWGLYLAVEGVEDAFLRRTENGEGALYKPDSMDMGGGRGNGRGFDFGAMDFGASGTVPDQTDGAAPPALPEDGNEAQPGPFGTFPQGKPEDMGEPPAFGGDGGESFPAGQLLQQMGGMNGSNDVKLQYIDDDPDSYANIFDNAKTDISDADKARLIASLQSLSAFENLENVLDTDAVLRYFVVHNFVVNGDSYTGSMIHNYYLYENGGRLSMIPWDYNLAFGTFQGGSAAASVNAAIDDVLSDRPMQAWIFSDEAYTRQYHALYSEFLDTVDIDALIDAAHTLIAPYVEKDPGKFCTYEEFETGVAALKTFCALRSESVRGQLAGTIPSTGTAQQTNSGALVDTGTLNISDMGTMNTGGGQDGFGRMDGSTNGAPGEGIGGADAPWDGAQRDMPENAPGGLSGLEAAGGAPPDAGDGGENGARAPAPAPADNGNSTASSDSQTAAPEQQMRGQRMPELPGVSTAPDSSPALLLIVSILVLLGGLVFAFVFRQ